MTTAPNIMTAQASNVADILKFQNDCLRTGKFTHLGHILRIVLEDTADSGRAPANVTGVMGRVLEFYENWLPVGQVEAAGFGDTFLLPEAPVRRKTDNRVGLPDIPDPAWNPSVGAKLEMEDDMRLPVDEKTGKRPQRWTGNRVYEQPRMIPQPLRQNSAGQLAGTKFDIFESVAQIMVKPDGLSEMWILSCMKNPANDTHMVFLIDEETGEAHFYGGRFTINRPGIQ